MANLERKGTFKVEYLQKIEREVQKRWEDEKIHEADAPMEPKRSLDQKFFATFPFPYMNGRLHLGHTFSSSKTEFAIRYNRLKGKHVLWPFGFHCTGMPIAACADKLKRELKDFGFPPQFPTDEQVVEETKPTPEEEAHKDKSKAKKTKAVAKTGTAKYQWEIMRSLGLKDEEIKNFADADYWLDYFPPLCVQDLKRVGLHIDFRRSFITTDRNPFFDSFVRWQFLHLKNRNKIMYGKRHTIYSPKDGQPCMDHDRASGEGVGPQEYSIIKLKLLKNPEKLSSVKQPVFMIAATLRPETMYGQTNIWVRPDIKYIAWQTTRNNEIWISSKRSARNMSYQNFTAVEGQVDVIAEITGSELLGIPISAPLTPYEVIYVLPMLHIREDKGTGIVASVPSGAPDDYAAFMDLKNKKAFREMYNITDEMVMPYELIPILEIPGMGDMCAKFCCETLKVQSQNDRDKLAKAKEMCYFKAFYDGTYLPGEYAGRRVMEVKPLIQKKLEGINGADIYYEPENLIVSRSGDECVVALCDQWYLNYGEEKWRAQATEMLNEMEFFHEETRNSFLACLAWLHEYACSRTYGLGTKVPWDDKWVIESLSDSTIHMAYYTIVHFLQDGSFRGEKPSPLGITPEDMTPEVWDYVFFQNAPFPKSCKVPQEKFDGLRREFEYWYPMDLRTSGKDLIFNHLTFMLYNHAAIWPNDKTKWPKGVRCNGFLMLNSAKMSKSEGNFLTLYEAVEKFSADGMRLCLADAGDSIDDANFVENTADAGILRLYTFIEWVKEMLASRSILRKGKLNNFNDKVFLSEMHLKTKQTDENYRRMLFKEALCTGFYEFQIARDKYRELCGSHGMHEDLVLEFIRRQALLMAPICPHTAEHVWALLGNKESIMRAKFPEVGEINENEIMCSEYLMEAAHSFRLALKNLLQVKGKGGKEKALDATVAKPNRAQIWVAKTFPTWQNCVLDTMRELYTENKNALPDNKVIAANLQKMEELKKYMKRVMPFAQMVREKVEGGGKGAAAFTKVLEFDERQILLDNIGYLRNTLELENLEIKFTDESSTPLDDVRPGSPYINFVVAPHVAVELVNPIERSGLFQVNTVISEGDSVRSLAEKLAKAIGLKSETSALKIWRYDDPVIGPRKIPEFQNYKKGKSLLTDGHFTVNSQKQHVALKTNGSVIDVGRNFVYIVE